MKNIGMLIRPITKIFFKQSNPEQPPTKIKFNIATWFIYNNSLTCVATCDPAKQRIYKIQGQLYLNIFSGFLHLLCPLADFSANIYQAIKIIFTHIWIIWCSGDWNVTEYIIKWFAVYKTSDPQTILGSFNRQLLDKVTSDTIEIHEKYKTPTQYKNFMSTIVLTNENALRVENDDRRTVFLDVSPARKGDLQYFKQLGNTMKYPGVGEAFYAYLKVIADKYPDFNSNPPPMTASKQEHIVSTLPPNNWIHETDEIDIEKIDIPKKSVFNPKALDQFLAQIGIDIPNKQKKSSPPSEQEPEAKQEPKVEQEPEQQPEIKSEPYGIPGPSIPAELTILQEVSKPVQKVDSDPMPKMNIGNG
ncbi:hypothetical protein RclHR1_35220001 [Rhizophagus clarus]|uniref:Uncharacterized protein n=1 Tax=Rhizophagus clarus TaxID=94130 RepID=A0A2Z6RR26_9GLOM|nr:hypothetical protein RclHR1_35220001 [Rhizophagus clarus]